MTTQQRTYQNADVVHEGTKVILPKDMPTADAIQLLRSLEQYEQAKITVEETFDVFPLDGACALDAVLRRLYGWAPATSTEDFFGKHPPRLITVEAAPGEMRQVPWGTFLLPNIKGTIETTVDRKDSRVVFAISAEILRLHEREIRRLFDELRAEISENSIYRGKAIKLRFRDDDGDVLSMPQAKFLNVDEIDPDMLVYSDPVYHQIQNNLFVPITRARDCIANGISLKRGVLLVGTFGVGKTLAAAVASKLAVQAGLSYVYVPRADELPDAIEFAKQYQSPACVVFCEDIDRVLSGERSVQIDEILNTIDGIDSKTANIIVVLTTNNLQNITPAMLRPGRLDAVIEVTPPDAKAVERLIRRYGTPDVPANLNLQRVCKELDGQIPAVVAEVVRRAKLAQLALQESGSYVKDLSEQALLDAAMSIRTQLELLEKVSQPSLPPSSTLDSALTQAVRGALNGEADLIRDMSERVRRVEGRILD